MKEQIKQQIKEEFEEMTEKVRDGIDDVTSGRLYDSNEKPSIRDWLKQHDKEHLFENEPYGEPMLDLSEEKLLAFLSHSMDKVHNEAIKEALEIVGKDLEHDKYCYRLTDGAYLDSHCNCGVVEKNKERQRIRDYIKTLTK